MIDRKWLSEQIGPNAILLDGLDDAVIGYGRCHGNSEDVVVYSYDKLVKVFMDRDGMDYEFACEWVDYNIVPLYAGPQTPFIMFEEVEHE